MPAPLTASSCPTSGPAPRGPRQGWGCGARRECPVSSRAYPARRHFTAWPRREFIEQVPACQTAVSRCPATASAGGTGSQNNLSCSLERPLGAFVLNTQPGGKIAVATMRDSGGRGVPAGELGHPGGAHTRQDCAMGPCPRWCHPRAGAAQVPEGPLPNPPVPSGLACGACPPGRGREKGPLVSPGKGSERWP